MSQEMQQLQGVVVPTLCPVLSSCQPLTRSFLWCRGPEAAVSARPSLSHPFRCVYLREKFTRTDLALKLWGNGGPCEKGAHGSLVSSSAQAGERWS